MREQLFYSYSMEDLSCFTEIAKQSAELSVLPENFDVKRFSDQFSDPNFVGKRQEIYRRPDPVVMLEREAADALKLKIQCMKFEGERKKATSARSTELCTNKNNVNWKMVEGASFASDKTRIEKLNRSVKDVLGEEAICVGDFLYPAGAYRSWHTNKYDTQGWAMFLVQVDAPGKSFFKYIDPYSDEVITVWDSICSVNFFQIRNSEPLFWHCIGSEATNRWSQGFSVPDNWKDIVEPLS